MKITLTVQDGTPQTFDYVVGGLIPTDRTPGAGGYFTGPNAPNIDLLASQYQEFKTVGAGNGPCKATIKVAPGTPKIVTATFGPAPGYNFATMRASIAGTPLPDGRGGNVGTAGGMLALGLNGAQGADINLTTGDHSLIIENAAEGDMGEKMVIFVIQP